MASKEIQVDYNALEAKVSAIECQTGSVKLEGSVSDISGDSDALEKFIALFEELKKAVNNYTELLSGDVGHTRSAIVSLKKRDEESADGVASLPELPQYSSNSKGE